MVISTYAMVYVTTYYKMGDMEVSYETKKKELTQTEVEQYNLKEFFKTPLQIKEGETNVRVDEIKITRTKKFFDWDTKVDTIKTYSYVIER